MTDYTFKRCASLTRLVEESKKRDDKEFWAAYNIGVAPEPCVWMVKDEGVYLMPAFQPFPNGWNKQGKNQMLVYAEDHGPKTWMPGDDWCVEVPLSWLVDSLDGDVDPVIAVEHSESGWPTRIQLAMEPV